MIDGVLTATEHPDFDLGMEILCTLSMQPTPMKLLKRDFDIEYSSEIVMELRRLRSRGLYVTFGDGCWIDRADWNTVRRECDAYWNKVHGEDGVKPVDAAAGIAYS